MTPTISTERLSLRPLLKPVRRNLAWLLDPEVVRFSEQRHHAHTLSTQLRYVESFSGRSCLWGIYLVENGEYIGNLSARHDAPNNVSDIGILIGETKYWGKGYGREAWARACSWLLDKDAGAIRKLEAGCARNNETMLNIIRRTGFVEEGERKNHFLFDGNPISAVLFGRT